MRVWYNNLKLFGKLAIPVITVVAIFSFIVVTGLIFMTRKGLSTANDLYTTQLSAHYADTVKAHFSDSYYISKFVSASLLEHFDKGDFDRVSATNMLKGLLAEQDNVFSIWVEFEPNVFGNNDAEFTDSPYGSATGSGRFSPYVYREGNTIEFINYANTDIEPNEDYYVIPKREGYYINPSSPYEISPTKTVMVTTTAFPMIHNGEFIGVFGSDQYASDLTNYFADIKYYENGYGTLIADDGTIVSSPNADIVGESIDDVFDTKLAELIRKTITNKETTSVNLKQKSDKEEYLYTCLPVDINNYKYTWVILMAAPLSEINRSANLVFIVGNGYAVIIVLILALFLNWLIKRTVKPVGELVSLAEKVAQGRVDVNVTEAGNDEIGQLVRAFGVVVEGIGEQSRAIERIAKGDFSVKVRLRSEDDVIAKSLNAMVTAQRKYVEDISDVMAAISNGDLKRNITIDYVGDFAPIKSSINNTLLLINTYVGETIRVLKLMTQGKLNQRIDMEFAGDFSALKSTISTMLDTQAYYIKQISETMARIYDGDLTAKINGDFSGDFKPIQTSINGTVEQLELYIETIKSVLSAIASGDLTQRVPFEFSGDFKALKTSLDNISASLSGTIKLINEVADQVADGAGQVSAAVSEIASGAQSQLTAVSDVLTATEDMSNSVDISYRDTQAALSINDEAMKHVEIGNAKMAEMISAMSDIQETSDKIAKIIRTINNISFQTNILALNAAIEAARAGESGRGFVVVADKVRELATLSGKAANEITMLINSSLTAVEHGSHIADETADALASIVGNTQEIHKAVVAIGLAASQQVNDIKLIDERLEMINGIVLENSTSTEESAASSEELAAQSIVLKNLISKFKTQN